MCSRLLLLAALSLTTLAVTFLPPATARDLYKWTDDKGRVHYSSTPPPDNVRKTKTLDTKALSNINAVPNDPSKDRADGSSSADDSDASESETPARTASSNESAPTSPPALIPSSLLAPSNPPTTAQSEPTAQPEIVEVVAQGMGIDANSALLNAYSNAVQQALGLYVDAETLVQNDEIVRDKILTYSKGFIQEASTVKESQANDLFQVSIRAKVKRQQLLEQAKTNNISVKAVEGVSLHAQVESQLKQETDAKALLEKALLPLTDQTLLRAELVPSTKEQPNPTINEKGTDEKFVTLDYKTQVFVDESKYYEYIKSNLIPVLNQIANRKQDFSVSYKAGFGNTVKEEDSVLKNKEHTARKEEKGNYSVSVLTWKDKGFNASKWRWFSVPKNVFPAWVIQYYNGGNRQESRLCNELIELSLLDEKGEVVSLGQEEIHYGNTRSCDSAGGVFPISLNDFSIRISPYFGNWMRFQEGEIQLKYTKIISIKILREDLRRLKTAKLEVKSVE